MKHYLLIPIGLLFFFVNSCQPDKEYKAVQNSFTKASLNAYTPNESLKSTPLHKWNTSSVPSNSPIVSNGTLFFATNSRVNAIDIKSRQIIWSQRASASNISPQIQGDHLVHIDHQNIWVFSAKTGEILWSKAGRFDVNNPPIIVGNELYLTSQFGKIQTYELNTGKITWDSDIQTNSNLVADEDYLYFISDQKQLTAVDLIEGEVQWQTPLRTNLLKHPNLILFEDQIYISSYDGYLGIFESTDGEVIFNEIHQVTTNKGRIRRRSSLGMVIDEEHLYISGSSFQVYNKEDLSNAWTFEIPNTRLSKPRVLKEEVLITTSDAQLISFNKKTGVKNWSVPIPDRAGNNKTMHEPFGRPLVSEGLVYLYSVMSLMVFSSE